MGNSTKDDRVDPYGLCPCGKSKEARFCCLIQGGWNKEPVSTETSEESSHSNPKCFAGQMMGCSKKISREHSVSASVLRLLGEDGFIEVSGLKFLGEKSAKLPISQLTTKRLCRAHNTALSGLDSEAARFLGCIIQATETDDDFFTLFAGEDIERWLAKTTLGSFAGGQLQFRTAEGKSEKLELEIPDELVECLFGKMAWPKGWGLYYLGGQSPNLKSLVIKPWIEEQRLMGVLFRIASTEWLLSLSSDGADEFERNLGGGEALKSGTGMRRPGRLTFVKESKRKVIHLTWQDSEDHRWLDLVFSPADMPEPKEQAYEGSMGLAASKNSVDIARHPPA